jgi:PleD family two-component response regulator
MPQLKLSTTNRGDRMPVAITKDPADIPAGFPFPEKPSILLASDSERLGSSLHRALRDEGFEVHYAGGYAGVDAHLRQRSFHLVLLEVTGEYAVELAVQAALHIKRRNAAQFVGYLADASLNASGLAGDGVFPRSPVQLPAELRRFLIESCQSGSEPGQA